MKRLKKPQDILILNPRKEDLIAGAEYASTSLPWTFNRMSMATSPAGQNSRAINIAKGIVGQEVLKRALFKLGIEARVQRKSYREDDLFDFRIHTKNKLIKFDLKTIHYYTDYEDVGRSPFSEDLLLSCADYAGPDWRCFFPMLVPHTQIGQDKEAYCFAIASSVRKNEQGDCFPAVFPYGESMPFFSSRKLCVLREEEMKGFYIKCEWDASIFDIEKFRLVIVGEWDRKLQKVSLILHKNKPIEVGPFSCISSFLIELESFKGWISDTSRLRIWASNNEFKKPVLNTSRRNINVAPKEAMVFKRKDLCNLLLPDDYLLYYIGWITKEEFIDLCKKYKGWVWPLDKISKFKNQPWSQITEKDKKMLERAGFDGCISRKPTMLNAGWMKTTGRGGGACCYVYPNIGRNGGVKETNLYILPKDLIVFDSLGNTRR